MGELTDQLSSVARRLAGRAAAEQAGVFSGDNPSKYNASDPIRLWVIQVAIIIAMTQALSLVLARIRQPRVISEVIGGIILGPTVMGRIPGFRNAIFPDAGMPMLTLTSTIGLVLFLFLVGLEIDTRIIKRNARSSSAISIAGLLVPLGLGAALGVGVYREFISDNVNFGYFLLFTAVAIGITAFPVLCRILTELKLLDTTVGIVTLSAGVGNDVVGWILLALTVALVNASNGLTALWVLLVSVGYVLFLLYPIRWGFVWLARRTGSIEQGAPTASMMTVTLLLVFASAFFTDIIGVHAIFGGFLAGLIIPQENGFAISLVEKLEDLVSILFLPIYFTLSGLRTNLGLLNTGATWGYIVLICLVAFSSKFFACGTAAMISGFNWRESGAIGALMSCKGLVELIVLNVGLQAGILDPRTFSMFVVHAIILTFITTPLTLLFYPEKYRIHEGSHTKNKRRDGGEEGTGRRPSSEDDYKHKFAIVLDKTEQLPAVMTLVQLLQPPLFTTLPSSTDEKAMEAGIILTPTVQPSGRLITLDALRLIELTNRTSAVLKSQAAESLLLNDPVISIFRTFGYLNRLLVSASLSVVNYDQFPTAIVDHVAESQSQMVLVPWSRGPAPSPHDVATEDKTGGTPDQTKQSFFSQTSSVVYSEFIRKVFLSSPSDVAVFVDRGLNLPQTGTSGQHLFLPFFGGPDDRLALSFLVQLCSNPLVSATVVRVQKVEGVSPTNTCQDEKFVPLTHNTIAADTVYGPQNTQTRLASVTADNLLWDRYSRPSTNHTSSTTSSLSRMHFDTCDTSQPLHSVMEMITDEIAQLTTGKNLVVVVGRSRRMAVESHQAELHTLITERGSAVGSALPKTLGDVGAALVAANVNASLLIMQSAITSSS